MKAAWQTRRLVDLCELFADGDWIESKDQADNGIRLIQTGNVGPGFFKDRAEKARYISPETFTRLRCQEIIPGDCLVSRLPDPAGRACLLPEIGERMITAVDCTIIRFRRDQLQPAFFNYFAQSQRYLAEVAARCTGTTRNRISRSNLSEVQIPSPPLKEQERIVAILDEAFEGIAAAKANAEKNLRSARSLFSSRLESLIGKQNGRWPSATLGSQIDLATGFPFKSQQYTESDKSVRLLRGDNIIQGKLRWDGVKKWPSFDVSAYCDYELRSGDVVIAMDRTWVKAGIKYAVLSEDDLPCLLVQRTARLRAKKQMDPSFLRWLVGCDKFTEYVLSVQKGSGVPHISGDQIKAFNIPAVPIEEQRSIASNLDALQAESSSLEVLGSRKIAALDELKQSLLHQAFTGKL